MDNQLIAQLLSGTLSSDGDVVRHATRELDRLSTAPDFPFSLVSIIAGNQNQSLNLAAATYLKNLIRRHAYGEGEFTSVSKQFKDQLVGVLLQAQSPILNKVLVESFRVIVDVEFVKKNTWPEIVSDLKCAIENSTLISGNLNSEWQTVNCLVILQALVRPFQYFLNPKVPKEPVPLQLELIVKEILVPLLAKLHTYVEKAISDKRYVDMDMEKVLLLLCKCIYFSMRSYMPSTLPPLLPSFSSDLYQILGSMDFDKTLPYEDGWQIRLKTAKRSLLIFCSLVTRHRKHFDKLMPDMMQCVLSVVSNNSMINKLDFLSERIVSLAFDVISHVLETGPGWRLVSPYFSSLLDSAIFTALRMNDKDISEWEEDAEEFIRKNFPSDLEEASGWREDLFTARKSAVNLLGVISMSKGPPVGTSGQSSITSGKRKKDEKSRGKGQLSSMGELLVVPFLSKFPMPSDVNVSDAVSTNYYGVLMGYGSLLDFLTEQKPEYTRLLIQYRVLPLYGVSTAAPYLIAAANWLLGELVCCLPEDMSADVYSSLLKALTMPDHETMSCYPVRVTAAGAMAALLENGYVPPGWLPLLQAIVGRIGHGDEETSMLFELLRSVVEAGDKGVAIHVPAVLPLLIDIISKCMPSDPQPWPQLVEQGFAVFSVMAKCWEDSAPAEDEQNELSVKWATDRLATAKAFSALLQQTWLVSKQTADDAGPFLHSCVDDASTLLWFVMRSVTSGGMLMELKVSELLLVWADLIANWHEWEEVEDLPMFDCIKEVVTLQKNFGLKNFFVKETPSPPAPPVPDQSIIEGIGAFVNDAISQYPSATRRACSCVHLLLHNLSYSSNLEDVKQSLVVSFTRAAISHFNEIQQRPCFLWKPLLLAVASSYLCYPDVVEHVLEKNEQGGFAFWLYALCSLASSSNEPTLSDKFEIKLMIMALAKLVEQLLQKGSPSGVSHQCFSSLLESCIRLKYVEQDGEKEGSDEADDSEDEDTDDDDDEDSEEEVREETEEEFLERYAKAAAALENGTEIEDVNIEDDDLETELGFLEELDQQKILGSLLERYHPVLIRGRALSPQLVSNFMDSYPEYGPFFNKFR